MGTTTTLLGIYKPDVSETGWGALRNTSYDTLDTALGTQHDLTGEHRFITVTDSSGYIKFPSLTTLERDALPVADGFTIYNTTTATLQTRQAGSWSDVVTAQLTVREQDLSPSVSNVNTIQFPNDSLTDLGSGVVSVDGFVEHTEGVVNGDMLYFDGVFWSRFAPGTAGQRLITNGPGAAPTWETALPVPVGLNVGDMLYYDGANWVSLIPGVGGQLLQTNGIGTPPGWITPLSGGNVTAALGMTDNAIVRGDGGLLGVQTSGILIDDTDNVTGIVNLTTTGTLTLNTVTYTYPGAQGGVGTFLQNDGSGNLTWAAGSVVPTFPDNTFRIQDDGDATKEIAFEASAITTGTTRTVTMPDADVDLGDIATNNAKVTNATHTGEVTGSGALTVDPTAITNKTTETAVAGEFILFSDTSDSGNLKKLDATDVLGGGGGGSSETVTRDINQTTHGFSVGNVLRHNGTTYVLAQADADANSDALGIVSAVAGVDDYTLLLHGYITGLSGLTAGESHFLSDTAAGALTATPPADTGEIVKPLIIADSTTSGYVNVMRGNEITGPTGITVEDEGSSLTTSVDSFDFVGAGVTATNVGDAVTVTIPGGGGATLTEDVNQTTHGFSVGEVLYHNGTIYALADASAAATAESIGVVSAVAGVDDFTIQFGGKITGLTGLTVGEAHFLSDTTAGAITSTATTTAGSVSKPVLIADSATSGFIFNMRGSEVTDTASRVLTFDNTDLTLGVFTANHNFGNQYIQVQVYNNNDDLVIPDDITLTDTNNADIDLSGFGAIAGTWRVVLLDSGGTVTSTIANDLALTGQTTGDTIEFNGTNWVRVPASERTYIGTFTRTNTDPNGTQAITGVGFQPTWVFFTANINLDPAASWGYGNDTSSVGISHNHNEVANEFESRASEVIAQRTGSSIANNGSLQSLDSDGFTVNWVKQGAPTGTTTIRYIAIR